MSSGMRAVGPTRGPTAGKIRRVRSRPATVTSSSSRAPSRARAGIRPGFLAVAGRGTHGRHHGSRGAARTARTFAQGTRSRRFGQQSGPGSSGSSSRSSRAVASRAPNRSPAQTEVLVRAAVRQLFQGTGASRAGAANVQAVRARTGSSGSTSCPPRSRGRAGAGGASTGGSSGGGASSGTADRIPAAGRRPTGAAAGGGRERALRPSGGTGVPPVRSRGDRSDHGGRGRGGERRAVRHDSGFRRSILTAAPALAKRQCHPTADRIPAAGRPGGMLSPRSGARRNGAG